MSDVNIYRKGHDGLFPTKFSQLFTPETTSAPTDEFVVFQYREEHEGRDYPTWEGMAAAIDGGELEGEYHYLGAGLPLNPDPHTVIILCDSIPPENGQDTIIVGLADGSSLQIKGGKATELEQNFKKDKRPLVLDDNAP